MSDIPNKLRFCCMPVLPTVFSDELSYMEVLCKMRDYINQMIEVYTTSQNTIHFLINFDCSQLSRNCERATAFDALTAHISITL